jgi:dipeptidyl aminopeptidase/acylaminoacyl peptidase
MRLAAVLILLVAVVAAAGLAAAHVALQSYRAGRSDFERTAPPPIARDPAQTGIPGLTDIAFAGTAGPLAAWYAPSRNRAAVVLVHGTQAERSSLLPETRILAAAGFGVLALDLPGQGASAGETRWGESEWRSVSAAVDWLSQRPEVDSARIGAFGLSFGGYVLLEAAARDPRLKALVLASTPEDLDAETRRANAQWGPLTQLPALWVLHHYRGRVADIAPSQALREIAPRPVFVLGGERDYMVPPAALRQLYEAAREPKELWIVKGAGHAGFAQAAPEEYAQRLRGFFLRTLEGGAAG